MRKVTLQEIYQMASDARDTIWHDANLYGREPKVYLHWSAGHYGQFFDDYHINIDSDGSFYVATDDFSDMLNHTYRRNTGSIGISMACCAFATTNDLGDEPPTTAQIDAMAQAIVAVCEGLWLTINKEHVMTHGEAADNEDGIYPHEYYGPRTTCERWDLELLGTSESNTFSPWATGGSRGGDVLRGKALWYKNEGGLTFG
mgnify:FL=1